MASDNTKTVAVIGAGIAGLVTAKTLAQDGFDVQVFEKGNDLGGTWALSRTYPGLRTNNTKQTYEFSDHPYPDDTELSPRADEVRSYLEKVFVYNSGKTRMKACSSPFWNLGA